LEFNVPFQHKDDLTSKFTCKPYDNDDDQLAA